ncbi:MAG: response regulator [Actinomycetes bacterium]
MGRTVLVVDDDPLTREILATILDLEDYRVVLAEDGETALDLVAGGRPDVIVLDVMMPGLNGFEVCRRLKDDPETAPIPVILLTALDRSEDAAEGAAAGCDAYLTKPFSPLTLIERIVELQAVREG